MKAWMNRVAGGVSAVALVLAACSEDAATPAPTPTPTPTQPGPSADPPGDEQVDPSACSGGQTCACPNGGAGKTVCEYGVARCSSCPPAPPPKLPDACGGDPSGLWRSTSLAYGQVQVPVTLNGYPKGTCAGQPGPEEPGAVFAMDLRTASKAYFVAQGLPRTIALSASCLGATCQNTSIDAVQCSGAGDTCTCYASALVRGPSGTWKTEGGKITLSDGKFARQLSYCVTGDKLEMFDASGAVINMVRTNVSGEPTACSDRPDESACRHNGDCWWGTCSGAGKCPTTFNANQCASWDCTWIPDQCSGSVPGGCDITRWSLGCGFTEGQKQCAGIVKDCATLTSAKCGATKGCTATPACTGTATADPHEWDGDAAGCKAHGGKYADTSCFELSCAKIAAASPCKSTDGCAWNLCSGEATPCEELDLATCSKSSGCGVEFSP